MKSLLLLGAGRSANVLIQYLEKHCGELGFRFTVADQSEQLILEKTASLNHGTGVAINVSDHEKLLELVSRHDLVISLLPPSMHVGIANMCLNSGKHLVTASYISEGMRALDAEATTKNLLLLNECGLDPGIDHMSALEILDNIREQGGQIHTFKSWCGGLVAPESDTNPWGYKISWNPWNVVQAGKGVSKFRENGKIKLLPYQQLFRHAVPVDMPGSGLNLEGYPNRDSLQYDEAYGLQDAKTIIRGTLRKRGYCKAWSVLVQLGLTDDSTKIDFSAFKSWPEYVATFLPQTTNLPKAFRKIFPELDDTSDSMLHWLGLFDEQNSLQHNSIGVPAEVLQQLIEKKWQLTQHDKDMIVMFHEIGFKNELGENKNISASLVVKGVNNHETAMAKTVGLPLGIAAIEVLKGNINEKGVCLPTKRTLYKPILKNLVSSGIVFSHTLY
jgi:saccharopine dehydrogenase-like NADP-dependent oxidoreductase